MVYFQTKNPYFGYFLGLGMQKMCIFYGHYGIYKSIWCILPQFGIFCGYLVNIFPLWYVATKKLATLLWLEGTINFKFSKKNVFRVSF
jgi:hypothetical protein